MLVWQDVGWGGGVRELTYSLISCLQVDAGLARSSASSSKSSSYNSAPAAVFAQVKIFSKSCYGEQITLQIWEKIGKKIWLFTLCHLKFRIWRKIHFQSIYSLKLMYYDESVNNYCQVTRQINSLWYEGLSHDSTIQSVNSRMSVKYECSRTDTLPT